MTASSKTRTLTALACGEPDRVPLDYSANPGIDGRLKAHFGLPVDDTEGLLRALEIDIRSIWPHYAGAPLHDAPPGRFVDEWGIRRRWVEHPTGGYWDYCDFPLAAADMAMVTDWPMPSPDDFDIAAAVARCRHHAALAVGLGGAGLGDIINSTGMLCGMERVLIGLIDADPVFLRLIDRRLAIQLEIAERVLDAAKGGFDFMWMGEDLGTQHAPLISLDLYRSILRPRHQQFIDLAKAWNLPVMIHTCGSSSWVYEDFIAMGIDAVDTLQPEAAHMAPEYLKDRFGGRLAFHGCISTAGVLATGTVDDVRADVRRTLATMMPGGGYILSPTHMIQDNTPTENVVAMYAAAREFGAYR